MNKNNSYFKNNSLVPKLFPRWEVKIITEEHGIFRVSSWLKSCILSLLTINLMTWWAVVAVSFLPVLHWLCGLVKSIHVYSRPQWCQKGLTYYGHRMVCFPSCAHGNELKQEFHSQPVSIFIHLFYKTLAINIWVYKFYHGFQGTLLASLPPQLNS